MLSTCSIAKRLGYIFDALLLDASIFSQTVIRHLKEDRKQWQCDTEELSALRIRNITLDNRIKSLEDELEDAREHHTPVRT